MLDVFLPHNSEVQHDAQGQQQNVRIFHHFLWFLNIILRNKIIEKNNLKNQFMAQMMS